MVLGNLPVDAVCPVCKIRLTATNTQEVRETDDVHILMCRDCDPIALIWIE